MINVRMPASKLISYLATEGAGVGVPQGNPVPVSMYKTPSLQARIRVKEFNPAR
jgi:hypothetical protein